MKNIAISALSLLSISAYAETVTFCYENVDSFPWSMPPDALKAQDGKPAVDFSTSLATAKNGTGLNMMLLKKVDENLASVEFVFGMDSWDRCLKKHLTDNTVQGVFSASYKEERLAFGAYPPLADGKEGPDKDRKLHEADFSFYGAKDYGWSGTDFADGGTAKTIVYQRGYSIGDDLKAKGYKVIVADNPSDTFSKLLSTATTIHAAAMLTLQGDRTLEDNPAKYPGVHKLTPPIVVKPYYLMLSKQFVAAKPELAKAIWDEIKKVRESEAYKAEFNEFLK